MPIGELYKTGENSPAHALYEWEKYTDGTRSPSPTYEERFITLETGRTFPPINSCDKGAWWKMTSYV